GGEAFAFNDNVYIVGGHNTIPLSSVERATILPDGTLEEWKRDTPLTDARVGAGIGVSNNVVYVVGGSNEGEYLRSVLRAYFVEGKPLGYWADDMQLATNAVFKRASVPLDAKNHFEKGWIFFMEKQYENSALEYELGIQIIPDFPQPYNMLGTALHNGKMFQKAIEAYGKAIKLEPGFGPFYFNKGNSHLALNQKVEAEAMFRKAMQLSPGFLNAKVRLFQLLSKEGRCAEIIAPLQELTSSYPENEFLKKISTRCM
ncbi:MAG: hypothetical protein ACE5FU_08485, partial [Nitrospinota bacterium]